MRAVAMMVLSFSMMTACASAGSHSTSAVSAEQGSIVIHIDNRNYNDMTIYVVHDGVKSRLDRVTAASTIVLTLPRRMVGQMGFIQLVAAPLGVHGGIMPAFSSERLVVTQARRIEWTLEDHLDRSYVGVY